jgi:hypothetical protein
MFREFVKGGLAVPRDLASGRAKLVAENALLRQQVIVLKRSAPRPHLKSRDRFTIATITKIFPVLLDAVAIVRPETVVRWHRAFWRLPWRRRSQRPVGRPSIDADTRALIIRMWKENPLRGEDVIAAELAKLGYHVSARTVAKYRPANAARVRPEMAHIRPQSSRPDLGLRLVHHRQLEVPPTLRLPHLRLETERNRPHRCHVPPERAVRGAVVRRGRLRQRRPLSMANASCST